MLSLAIAVWLSYHEQTFCHNHFIDIRIKTWDLKLRFKMLVKLTPASHSRSLQPKLTLIPHLMAHQITASFKITMGVMGITKFHFLPISDDYLKPLPFDAKIIDLGFTCVWHAWVSLFQCPPVEPVMRWLDIYVTRPWASLYVQMS